MAEGLSIMIPVVVALIAAIIGPWIIEYWKWRSEPKNRILHESEVRYFTLLTNLEGFFENHDPKKIAQFYEHYRTAWLYAPDEVIKAINRFFEAQGVRHTKLSEADEAACNMVWQMRKAFYRNTKLRPEEFLIVKPRRR